MKLIFNCAMAILLLLSAASLLAQTPDSGTSVPATGAGTSPHVDGSVDDSPPAAPGSGSGTVAETIEVENYMYLRLAESDTWVAASNKDVAIGDKVKYRGAIEMRNFHSRTLDRTFDVIFFTMAVEVVDRNLENVHEIGAAMQQDGHPVMEKPRTAPAPTAGEIAPLQGGTTIAALLADAGSLEGQAVQLRARVTKVSANVAGKNWVTLQDGSSEVPAIKLLATSADTPEPGETVVAAGTVRNNVDIGAGYKYDVLLEDASFKTE